MNTNLNDIINNSVVELKKSLPEEFNSFNGVKEFSESAFRKILAALFPQHVNPQNLEVALNLSSACDNLKCALKNIVSEPEIIIADLIKTLPEIKRILLTDIKAAYQGDPAARNYDEIILAYPAFIAISAYRIANELFLKQVPLIPRIITEYAHRLTGIDIHPGATIGEYFFIDHGTGVVIGETVTIGAHAKLYQNVTLGAKSFKMNPDGTLVKNIKRHPDIGNDVVIYAGATILGGDTVIGDGCIIGGNVWLTHSVEAGQVILNELHER